MIKVSFDYEPWAPFEDQVLFRPGTPAGRAAIATGMEVRQAGENREIDRDSVLAPTVDGVVEIIAGGIEWLRWFGLTAEDVQARVLNAKTKNLALPEQVARKATLREVNEFSDVDNVTNRMDPNKLIDQGVR